MIPLWEPFVNCGNAKKYINECIETNWISTAGSFVTDFESMIANYIGVEHAIAVNSGTSALHLAMIAGGVLPNEEVIVPALSYVATANAVKYVGAFPVFMDCEPGYCQMNINKLENFLYNGCYRSDGVLYNRTTERIVKAIMPVPLFGHPIIERPYIEYMAKEFNLIIIEDAAPALGGAPVGRWGDMSCFSFNGNKIITCGGGGMLTTDNEIFAKTARHLSNQAKCSDMYIHDMVGYNYRMTNLHAALGCSQLEQLTTFIIKKRKIAKRYTKALPADRVRVLEQHPGAYSNYWASVIFLKPPTHWEELHSYLKSWNIQTSSIWKP